MIKNFTFKVGACFTGDVLYLLKAIKSVCEDKGVKADIYIWLDRPVKSYDGAVHPYGNSGINRYAFDMLRPLLLAQPYINSVEEYAGQDAKVDLDELRTKVIAPMPYGSITRWAGYAWPDMQGQDEKWIDLILYRKDIQSGTVQNYNWIFEKYCNTSYSTQGKDFDKYTHSKTVDKIIINRTSRYQNSMIHYWFLKEHQQNLIFAGLPDEHAAFCKTWELDIPLLEVQDFLELAVAIASCRYFIGNQSMCFALAEAMQVPRLLEVCPYAPNVIPSGKYGYDFLHQFALEWFVKNEQSPLNRL